MVYVRLCRSIDWLKKGREWFKEVNVFFELKNFVECFEFWFVYESDVILESSVDFDVNFNDEEFLDVLL